MDRSESRVSDAQALTPERSRDRVLSRTELKELWKALHETEAPDARGKKLPRLSQTLNDALLVVLLTAQRGGEVWYMRCQDLDLDTGWWMIPAESTKNADPHRVPLTPLVVAILKRRMKERDDRYVFSNYRHTCIADRAKKAASTLCKGLTFHFRAHDLRRTAASYMGEAGVDRFHIAHVLNHRSVTHSSVTAIYTGTATTRRSAPRSIDRPGSSAKSSDSNRCACDCLARSQPPHQRRCTRSGAVTTDPPGRPAARAAHGKRETAPNDVGGHSHAHRSCGPDRHG